MAQVHVRFKRHHQKVKTGCITCRKRRIKCDEAKPTCRQCTNSSRRCEGYQSASTWLYQPPPAAKSPAAAAANNALVPSVAALAPLGDALDIRSFQFWHEKASPIFSCYFGHSFWTQMLPQMAMIEPAIKHLLLATSSLAELAALDRPPLGNNAVYQSHYNKALQATRSSPSVETVLVACLLFASCEFMQASVLGGLHHINAGLNIIDEWYRSVNAHETESSPEARLIVNAIGPIFYSYLDKAPTYGIGDIRADKRTSASLINPSYELPFVGEFSEVIVAHHALDGIAHHIARLMDWRRKAWSPSPPQKIQILLERWRESFLALEDKMTESRKQHFAQSMQMLRIQHTMLSIVLQASSSNTERVYAQFDHEFQWIVTEFDTLSIAWNKLGRSKTLSGAGNLEYHMGYIPPLFFTAIKCRVPATRMAALAHLRSLKVWESAWTSCIAYSVADAIIRVENTRAMDSPLGLEDERSLIRPVEAYVTETRTNRVALEYSAFPYNGAATPVMVGDIDLQHCNSAALLATWPLCRILRIGGYQGGIIKPVDTLCQCSFHS